MKWLPQYTDSILKIMQTHTYNVYIKTTLTGTVYTSYTYMLIYMYPELLIVFLSFFLANEVCGHVRVIELCLRYVNKARRNNGWNALQKATEMSSELWRLHSLNHRGVQTFRRRKAIKGGTLFAD